ncbi:CoA transferase, partial [Candidatus Frankia alpina]
MKIEHPETGDPQRGLELLYKLVQGAEVFLTNLLPDSCERFGVGVEKIREANPDIIYARGHGQGAHGPDANLGSYDVVGSKILGQPTMQRFDIAEMPNPLTNVYRTGDDRFLWFSLLQADRHWPEFCAALECPNLLADPRYVDAKSRFDNRREC